MGGLLDGGKAKEVKPPPVPDPPPVPVVEDEAEESFLADIKRASGISKTFITGPLTPKSKKKKKTLG